MWEGEQRWSADEVAEAVFNLDEEVQQDDHRPHSTIYPSTSHDEDIVCSAFGTVVDNGDARYLACPSVFPHID